MGGETDSAAIKAINKAVIHKICSGQVILDLSSAVKELVENSLDAGATSIEICLKEHGEESFKVIDNGCGISPNNFQALALKHHTSKIADFSDLHSLTTFGFRGEALSSLCALGNLTVETRTKTELVGTHLTFDHSGLVTAERKTARQIGTTVTVEKLFSTLPVRNKEFSRNIRREYGKLISLLNAYALIAKGVRLLCTNISSKNNKSVVLKTQGSSSIKDNIITVFGLNTFQCLEPLNLCTSEDCKIEGFFSRPGYGSGRNLGDRQFFYVNGRPVDMPKVSKLINELYKCANSKQYPIAIMNFVIPATSYDVNVTPDKRKIFLTDEGALMLSLRDAIEKVYSPQQCSYSVNKVTEPEKDSGRFESDPDCEDKDISAVPKPLFSDDGGKTKTNQELILNDSSSKTPQVRGQDLYVEGGISHGDGRASSKDFTLKVCEINHSTNPSAYQCKQTTNSPKRNIRTDGRTLVQARSLKKGNSSCPSLVQSSLTKFVSINKRKHEDSCDVLSEMPILRNVVSGCQVRKTSSEMLNAVSRSLVCNASEDNSPEDYNDKLSECDGAPIVSSGMKVPLSVECDVFDVGLAEENSGMRDVPLSFADAVPEASPGKDLENVSRNYSYSSSLSKSCDVVIDLPNPSSCLRTCSLFQFNLNDLKTRRQQRLSRLYLCSSAPYGKKTGRCYTAATLENFQPEGNEGKARSLAAATIELERFFRKEDFSRMQVVGQFNLGFIIGKVDQDLFIIDQHAADEKCNFERLSQSTIFNQQPLLHLLDLELFSITDRTLKQVLDDDGQIVTSYNLRFISKDQRELGMNMRHLFTEKRPIRLELSPEEEVVASMNMKTIRKNGFALIEDEHAPPGRHFLLKAIPFSKNITFGVEDLKDLISTLADSQEECSVISSYKMDTPDSVCPSRVRAMLASRACRTSVMIGDPLMKCEMQKILHSLAELKCPWNCPHGRPTMRHLANLTIVSR